MRTDGDRGWMGMDVDGGWVGMGMDMDGWWMRMDGDGGWMRMDRDGGWMKTDGDGGWMGMEVAQGCPVQAVGPSWERGCCAHSGVPGLAGSSASECTPGEATEPPGRPQPGSG